MLVDVQLSSLIPSALVLSYFFWIEIDDSKMIVKKKYAYFGR